VDREVLLGESVSALARSASKQVLLCAPFSKAAVIERLLGDIDAEVEVELFTRWRADEVAAGVSDTAVLPLVEERGGSVFLCEPLHAKLFRFDSRALVGSANLTGSALGWSTRPNLELLVEVPVTTPEVATLERKMRQESIPATAEIAADVERAAALLRAPSHQANAELITTAATLGPWCPLLRDPSSLFKAYSRGSETLSSTSAAAAAADLEALEPPPRLDRHAFESLIATRLLQSPLLQQVDGLLAESQRFGAISGYLGDALSMNSTDASYAWQTLMRWMLYFLPKRYARTVPSHSEVMVRLERPQP
jgi:PLD-like domain